MKFLPAGLGAEPKKLVVLGALLGVLVVVYFMNRTPDSPAPSTGPVAASPAIPAGIRPVPVASRGVDSVTPMPPQRTQRVAGTTIQDFKPSLKPAEGTDVSRIDPTLRLDQIAKLRTVALTGGARSIFDFGAPPAPKALPVLAPIKPVAPPKPVPPPVAVTPPTPAPPAAPPIPLRFYGYVDASAGALRKAFFLLGDDIFVAGENDVVSNRYRILRINANFTIVEDTATKNQQTLPLIEELPG